MGSVDFAGTLIKNDLAITYSIPVQGQTLEIKMTGVVDKDTMSGTARVRRPGQAAWSRQAQARGRGRAAARRRRPRRHAACGTASPT